MPGHFTFYTTDIRGDIAVFDESETRHAIQALRYQPGDAVEFTDGLGHLYTGTVLEAAKKTFSVRITETRTPSGLPRLKLGIGLIKHADRLEWLTEKCTELGVEELIFLQTANTEKSRLNTERLQRVAISALKQSHGCRLPVIRSATFAEALSLPAENRLIGHCQQDQNNDEGAASFALRGDCLVLIGPEGDFTIAEVQQAHAAGFRDLSLGNTVLRTETAGMVVAGVYAVTGG